MNQTIHQSPTLVGTVVLPGDKSVALRSALFAALGEGASQVVNYPTSADPQSMLSCLRQLGVEIEEEDGILYIEGVGLHGLKAPDAPIDCGNSGTAMRLLAGVLAGQPFESTLVGDASLSSRPMARIANPLREMGAEIAMTNGFAPLHIRGNPILQGITYRLPMASAQVKSCVLLAGLYAAGETTVIEPTRTRNHTEQMLGLDHVDIGTDRYLTIQQGQRIPAQTYSVPRDFSAAAFFLVAGTIAPQAIIDLPSVGLNPSRSALLDVLRLMGADIAIENERERGGELLGELTIRSSKLHGVRIDGDIIPNLIDEIPILAVAATCAEGRTEIREAEELRVKETDRIDAMVKNLRALGAEVEEFDDGLAINGGAPLKGATVPSYDDHRIAMAMGVAGLVAEGSTTITDADAANVTFPDFWEQLKRCAAQD